MRRSLLPGTAMYTFISVVTVLAEPAPERYDVEWDTPSRDSFGSMPLGNGDIGLNLWVEPSGDVVFYLSKTDAWSENGRLLKLGRVRLRFEPSAFTEAGAFSQRLDLKTGSVIITGTRSGQTARLTVRADANQPLVVMGFESAAEHSLAVDLEHWRTARRKLEGKELFSAYGLWHNNPEPVYVEPDVIAADQQERILWYHRNERSVWRDNLTLQAMGEFTDNAEDPLLHRTFGAAVYGSGLAAVSSTSLASSRPSRRFEVNISPLTARTATADEWIEQLDRQIQRLQSADPLGMKKEHEAWWNEFWDRSWIHVGGLGDEAFRVSGGYALQRFILACAGRGGSPIKFNGSLFTVDARVDGLHFDADYRHWGGPYWFMNTRLAYWPMLPAGDFEMMHPLFRMYLEALPLARARTVKYYGHEGVFYPETMNFWGTYTNENYGWDREGKPDGLLDNRYIRYYWSGALELICMMLDYCSYSGDAAFLGEQVIPFATEIITFYDQHYARDAQGKLRIEPAQALETYWDVPNPAPEIAGLNRVLNRLLGLPTGVLSTAQAESWRRLLGELPDLPTRIVEKDGRDQVVLSAAELLINKNNLENPELYPIWPYELFGIGRSDLDLARRTFDQRLHKGSGGWQQDAIQAACLGLADEARRGVVHNFTTNHAESRFPAFWGPNFDWIPDQDHGGVAMIALQKMLLQEYDGKLCLLPAWPSDWNVHFKLHAPDRTTVQAVYRDGELKEWRVSPESRSKDVVFGKGTRGEGKDHRRD